MAQDQSNALVAIVLLDNAYSSVFCNPLQRMWQVAVYKLLCQWHVNILH